MRKQRNRRWAVMYWQTAQSVKLLGFVYAPTQPHAMARVMAKYPAAKSCPWYFVRAAWKGATNHYTELRFVADAVAEAVR